MRLASLSTWSWGESVALEQQRKITGVHNVLMHEDVLQAIFLHYIGVKWSVFLKSAFVRFREFDGAWASSRRSIPQLDLNRRGYYTGTNNTLRHQSVYSARERIYRKHYFMSGLMNHDEQKQGTLDGEEEADYSTQTETYNPMPMQQAMVGMAQQMSRQHQTMAPLAAMTAPMPAPRRKMANYARQVAPRVPEDDVGDCNPEDCQPMEDKQRLIRLLSTEIAINTKLHGEVTAFHAVFESWNSLLPHETILAVMSLLGVSDQWIAFFTKFLRAPLKFLDDGPATKPRTRRRGTPASHALSDVFGESILFCLDLTVNKATGGRNLHRMQDDFWFWTRDHGVAKTAWAAVSSFVDVTRTYIDLRKSGTVRIARDPSVYLEVDRSLPAGDIRWGFLKLSPRTGRFEIDQVMVDKHIVDLRRQLADKQKSVIAFIQTWNAFAATFFTANFGKPANCFGQAHVDEILATHQRIERDVFSSSSAAAAAAALSLLPAGESPPDEPITGVVAYLKHLLRTRFGVSDVPDAYLFFPLELGGLDLRSPFVSVLPVREAVDGDPARLLDQFLEAERDNYARKKLAFERSDGRARNIDVWGGGVWTPDDPAERERFFALDEYARYREDVNYDFGDTLAHTFERLLEAPSAEGHGIQEPGANVRGALEALAAGGGSSSARKLKGITGDWESMDPYWCWVAQLYGPEAVRRFGGLGIVEPGLLPMGMVSIFRDKRVKWQG
ncbi:hypothetical protein F4802DRAFT_566524 [Xylaria palmicola]|nr:hypothetical protein F4802DRAFT_566524 [Xylaria palmicola]